MVNYGEIHKDGIYSMATTEDYLITSDLQGNLKQWQISSSELVHDYGQAHSKRIVSITIGGPSKEFLFTSDSRGNLKQFEILKKKELVKDYGQITQRVKDYGQITDYVGILYILASKQFLWTSDEFGHLKQWSIKGQNIIKSYDCFQKYGIKKFVIVQHRLISHDWNGFLKIYDLRQDKEEINYQKLQAQKAHSIEAFDGTLFITDNWGVLREYD